MSDEQKVEVKNEQPESPVVSSATEKKAETKELKILGKEGGNLTPEAKKEWEEQPEIVAKDGKSVVTEPEVEPEKGKPEGEPEDDVSKALELEKQRIADKREKLLAEIRQGKSDNRQLKTEIAEEAEELPEPISYEDDGWKLVDKKIEQRFREADVRREFYTKYPVFYDGDDGLKNREVTIEFAKSRFKELTPESLEMSHNYIFGEFDKDLAIREAKQQQTNKMLAHQAATLGSGRGKTSLKTAEQPRKRILPKSDNDPKSWY